jgi:hypothetical protein
MNWWPAGASGYQFNWKWLTVNGYGWRVVTMEKSPATTGTTVPSKVFPDNLASYFFGRMYFDPSVYYFSYKDLKADNG